MIIHVSKNGDEIKIIKETLTWLRGVNNEGEDILCEEVSSEKEIKEIISLYKNSKIETVVKSYNKYLDGSLLDDLEITAIQTIIKAKEDYEEDIKQESRQYDDNRYDNSHYYIDNINNRGHRNE